MRNPPMRSQEPEPFPFDRLETLAYEMVRAGKPEAMLNVTKLESEHGLRESNQGVVAGQHMLVESRAASSATHPAGKSD